MNAAHEMLRSLVRSPGFTLSVVLTLGLAIGANSALFTLVDQVIFRPLPVSEPSELVVISAPVLPVNGPFMTISSSEARGEGGEDVKVWGLSYPAFVRLAKRVPAFRETMGFFDVCGNMPADDRTLEIHALLVTGSYFRALGIQPSLGRFPDADVTPNDRAAAVLSHGFWQRQFGGDPGILNRTIRLNSSAVTVVGVAPSGFTGTVSGMRVDLFVPLQMADAFEEPKIVRLGPLIGINTGWDSPVLNRLTAVARLAAGVSRRDAEKAADVVYHQLQAESIAALRRPLSDQSRRRMASDHLTLLPAGMAGSQQVGTVQALDTVLSLLMGMVALVLLVAAGNVANLQVAHGWSRMRETAIRLALGATRGRLLRGRLVETLALAFLSGAVGLLLSSWLTPLVPAVLGLSEMPPGVSSTPDWRVVLFTVAVSAATGLLIWSVSAIQVTRRANLPTLSGSSVVPARAGALVVRRALLLVQVALSAALLCGAALLTRSLVGLMLVNPGFDVSGLAAFTVTPGRAAYDEARARVVAENLVARARTLPGIVSASASSHLPLSGGTARYWLLGDDPAMDRSAPVLVDTVKIGEDYFETIGLPLVAGRGFTPADRVDTPKVAVLSERKGDGPR